MFQHIGRWFGSSCDPFEVDTNSAARVRSRTGGHPDTVVLTGRAS